MKNKLRKRIIIAAIALLALPLTVLAAAMLHGDFNGDGVVGSQDAGYLLQHLGDPDALGNMGDVNGDGKIDEADALYLLRHSLNPEKYPLDDTHDRTVLPGQDPTCTQPGMTEGVYCSICGEVYTAQEEIPALGHDFADGSCTRCGVSDTPDATQLQLEVELLEDGSGYILTGVTQFFGDSLVIPDTYEGLPIVAVASQAFNECLATEITLGENIQVIQSCAFYNCPNLTTIYILREDVRFDGSCIAYGCDQLTQIIYSGDPVNNTITDGAFGENAEITYNHNHSYTASVITAATCTQPGVSQYSCSHCDRSYQQATEALGHNFSEPTRLEPTCEQEGLISGYCQRCSLTTEEVLPATGHNVTYTQQEAPTCGAAGVESGECANCHETLQREIPALSHTPGEFISTGGTCGDRELGKMSCTLCGQTIYEASHITERDTCLATCTQPGYSNEVCTNCGTVVSSISYPITDHLAGDWVITTAAGCDQTGTQTQSCKICGTLLATQEIPMTGHALTTTGDPASGSITYTCGNCDYTETVTTEGKLVVTLVTGFEPELPALYVESGAVPQLPAPAMEDMRFLGWYTNSKCSTEYENTPVTADITLYAAWEPTKVTATAGKDGVVYVDTTDYQFVVESPVALSTGNVNDYITVTNGAGENVDLFVAQSSGSTYHIGGNFTAADVYAASATGGIIFTESDQDTFWFVISGPARNIMEFKDGVVTLTDVDLLGLRSDGTYDYLLTKTDCLNVGQMVLVTNAAGDNIIGMYEVVEKSGLNTTNEYKCAIADPSNVLSDFSFFNQQRVDMSQFVPAENWEDAILEDFKASGTYAAFEATVDEYARERTRADSKYSYVPSGIEPDVWIQLDPDTNEVIFYLELSARITRINKATGQKIDIFRILFTLENACTIDTSISTKWIWLGYGNIAITTHNRTGFQLKFTVGAMDNDDQQEDKIRELFQNNLDKKDLLPIDADGYGEDKKIPIGYVPIPLPAGFAIDISLFGIWDWEIVGEFGLGIECSSTVSNCLSLVRMPFTNTWTAIPTVYSGSSISAANAYLAGRIRASIGLGAEVGITWVKVVRLSIEPTVSVYLEAGGLLGLFYTPNKPLNTLLAGYMEAGVNVHVDFILDLLLEIRVELIDVDNPFWGIGTRKLPLRFEAAQDTVSINNAPYGKPINLHQTNINYLVRVQDLRDMSVETEKLDASEYRFELLDSIPGVTLTPDGVLTISARAEENLAVKIRIYAGTIYKDMTLQIQHKHNYTVTKQKGTCTTDEVNYYVCRACSYAYDEIVTPAPGHDFSNFIAAQDPTCEEIGWKDYTTCVNCDATTYEELPALGHNYSLEILEPEYLYKAATCQNLAQYYYICANCGGHSDSHLYEHGELADHVYEDPFTCHDRPCQTPNCTYVSLATTPHRFTPWYEIETGSCPWYEVEPDDGSTVGFSIRSCYDCSFTETTLESSVIHAHNWEVQPELAPTCDTPGYQDYILCTNCGKVANKTEVPPLEHNILYRDITDTTHVAYCHRRDCDYVSEPATHNHKDPITLRESTCAVPGRVMTTCVCGHTHTEDLPLAEHQWKSHAAKSPTCVDIGWNAYKTCSNCDATTYEEIPALGHQLDQTSYWHDAGGHKEQCSRPGCTDPIQGAYQTHSFSSWVVTVKPTCTKDGTDTRKCTVCQYQEQKSTPATGHDESGSWQHTDTQHYKICPDCQDRIKTANHTKEVVKTVAHTCTEDGYTVYRCSTCHYSWKSDFVTTPGHDNSGSWQYTETQHYKICPDCKEQILAADHSLKAVNTVAPTCTEKGYTEFCCSICQYSLKGNFVDARHNESGSWQHTETQHYKTCPDCQAQILTANHTSEVVKTVAPTCAEQGYTVYRCSICRYSWNGNFVETVDHDKRGSWQYTDTQHYKICPDCKEQILTADHTPEVIKTVAPTCTEKGYTVYRCSTCQYSWNGSFVDETGHDESGSWQYTDTQHYKICPDCQARIKTANHTKEVVKTVAPTCTEKGYTVYRCSTCQYSWNGSFVDIVDHDKSGKWQYTDTQHYKTCPDCKAQILTADHTSEVVKTVAPTCTEKGYTVYRCSTCQYSWNGSFVDIVDHDKSGKWQYTDTQHYKTCPDCKAQILTADHTLVETQIVAATCTEGGYSLHSCSTCQYQQKFSTTPELGHDKSGKWQYTDTQHYKICDRCQEQILPADHSKTVIETVAPTCTEGGYTKYRCSTCGYSWEADQTGPQDHDYIQHSGKESTCTEAGWIDYLTCSSCDFTTYQALPIIPHEYNTAWYYNDQYHYHICIYCKTPAPQSEWIRHSTNTEITEPATCTEPGNQRTSCVICDYYRDAPVDPNPDHDHSGKWQYNDRQHYRICPDCRQEIDHKDHSYKSTTVAPDCVNGGYILHTCSTCGYSYKDSYKDALGHADMDVWHHDSATDAHYHRCSRTGCGYETDRSTHSYTGWRTTTEPTCAATGEKARSCTVCQHTITETVEKLPHELYEGTHTESRPITGGTEFLHSTANLCRNCDYYEVIGDAIVHKHADIDTMASVPATCTETGLTTGIICLVPGCGEILKAQQVTAALGHDYLDGYCTRCGAKAASTGLRFQLSSDKTYYIVKGMGTCEDTDLVISAIHEGLPVKEIGYDAFRNSSTLISVTIPESVTTIGSYAFYNCTSLVTVAFDKDSQLTTIGYQAFYNCKSLTSITIPESVTTIGDEAFYYCTSLTSVILSQDSHLTTIGNSAFNQCTKLQSITIPDRVTTVGNHAFYYCTSLTSIAIPTSVISIGNYAFCNCTNLDFVTFGENSQLTTIGKYAFFGCGSLTSVTFGENSRLTTIGEGAFYHCSSLTSITIPDKVTTIGEQAFNYCSNLASVTFSQGSQLTTIGKWAFAHCTKLETIYYQGTTEQWNAISKGSYWDDGCNYTLICLGDAAGSKGLDYKPSSDGTYYIVIGMGTCEDTDLVIPATHEGLPVKEIGDGAFKSESTLTSVTIPDSVTTIGYQTFYNCINLTRVTIPDSITGIGDWAFRNCSSLTSVTFTKNSQLVIIGDSAFCDCSKLTSISIPNNTRIIGPNAFYGCTELTSVTLDTNSQLIRIGYGAFYSCQELTSITIPDSVVNIEEYTFSFCNQLATVNFSKNSRLTTINYDAFTYCRNLTSFQIPESVTFIGDCAFYGCNNLTSISIPDKVISIGTSAFADCSKLTSITIPEKVTIIGYNTFSNCTSLTSITIPASVTAIGEDAFIGCTRLRSVTFSPNSQLTAIGKHAFDSCTSLTSIAIPASVTSIDEYAFYYCSKLIAITIPAGVTSVGEATFHNCSELTTVTFGKDSQLTTIGDSAFSYCPKLTSITIPDRVTTIDEYAFFWCDSLTSVTFGKDSQLTTISSYAFSECTSLQSITIPDSVTTIGNWAFDDCTKLETIYYQGTTEQWNAISKGTGWDMDCNYTLVCLGNAKASKGLTYELSEDGSYYAVTGMEDLTDTGLVILPTYEGLPVKEIRAKAFENQAQLTSVTLPGDIAIEPNAFAGCTGLQNIYILGAEPAQSDVPTRSAGPLPAVATYYYSMTEPEEGDGNYWRYVDDRPTAWS